MVGGKSVLVLIDVQKAWLGTHKGKWANPGAVDNMARLLVKWRSEKLPVIHVRHDSLEPDSPLKEGKDGFAFQEQVKPLPGERIITKHVNSAFIGTDLEKILHSMGDPEVVMCGLVTDHCVSTTARMSGNLGFDTVVVSDACDAYAKDDIDGVEVDAQTIHRANLASLSGQFATLRKTDELV